jgi:hypothetical protein
VVLLTLFAATRQRSACGAGLRRLIAACELAALAQTTPITTATGARPGNDIGT